MKDERLEEIKDLVEAVKRPGQIWSEEMNARTALASSAWAVIPELVAEVERLRAVLAEYADEHNWEWIWRHDVGPDWAVWTGPSKLAPDELAKAALDGKETSK
jgi:hypothetical protein